LDPKTYYEKFMPKWTGSVCGRVTKEDGTPFDQAQVGMSEIREKPLSRNTASDLNLSKPDGSFCMENIRPGSYLLSAVDYDYGANTRLMGYYPGVGQSSGAVAIEVKAGARLTNVQFSVRKQPLFKVRSRIVTSDGSPLPWRNLGVAIDSPERDALAYHELHGVNEDGSFTFALIPPGHYLVRTITQRDFQTGEIPLGATKWKGDEREVEITGNTEVVLRLTAAN
jgi:hypothetical protein